LSDVTVIVTLDDIITKCLTERDCQFLDDHFPVSSLAALSWNGRLIYHTHVALHFVLVYSKMYLK